jgi:hypothetical protein
MRMLTAIALILCGFSTGQGQTNDEPQAIIQKAIKAMGYDKEPKDVKGYRTTAKGTLEIMGASLPFTQTVNTYHSGQFRDSMELEANNMKIPVITVFDGNKGWIEVNGKLLPQDDKITAELKEVASLLKIGRLSALLDKQKYELAAIGEVEVNEKPALGVRITRKKGKDLNIFFDKKSHMVTKIERTSLDPASGMEVQEERIIKSYQDKDGRKIPHKIMVIRDGKKLLEGEVIDNVQLNSIDANEFDMPK